MIFRGFTVTFVRRRQVPKTCAALTSRRLRCQATGLLTWTQSLPNGAALTRSGLACRPDPPDRPAKALQDKSG